MSVALAKLQSLNEDGEAVFLIVDPATVAAMGPELTVGKVYGVGPLVPDTDVPPEYVMVQRVQYDAHIATEQALAQLRERAKICDLAMEVIVALHAAGIDLEDK